MPGLLGLQSPRKRQTRELRPRESKHWACLLHILRLGARGKPGPESPGNKGQNVTAFTMCGVADTETIPTTTQEPSEPNKEK